MIIIAEQNRRDSDMVELYSKGVPQYMIGALHVDHFFDIDGFHKALDEGPVELEIRMI